MLKKAFFLFGLVVLCSATGLALMSGEKPTSPAPSSGWGANEAIVLCAVIGLIIYFVVSARDTKKKKP